MNSLTKTLILILVVIQSQQNEIFSAETTTRPNSDFEQRFQKAFPMAKLKQRLAIKEQCHLSTTYYKDHGIHYQGKLGLTILDEHDKPLAEIKISDYNTLYEKGYEEKPYKTMGRFKYNMAGSRSYATNSTDKGGKIVVSQIYFSSRNKKWDVFICKGTHKDELARLARLAKEIDVWLSKSNN